MKWNEIPSFTECRLINPFSYGFLSYVDYIENEIEKYHLEMNPDFQRGHIWTEDQQSKYIEFMLRGGKTGRDFYFNWNQVTNEYVCVDGLQRTTALQKFVHNELKVFGQYFDEFEFPKRKIEYATSKYGCYVYQNNLKTKKEVLQWYVDMNAGSTPHTNGEIERVKKMIKEIK